MARGRRMKDRKQPGVPQEVQSVVTQTTKKSAKGQPALGREIQAKIGQQLRAYYDTLIEPAPQRFADLLRKLDRPGDKGPTE
jgi:Anti-sigma factor NepR